MPMCKICSNKKNNKLHIVKEMMFGTREEFEYVECALCGCIQIRKIPENISKYYPDHYNAYDKVEKIKDHKLKRFFKMILTDYCFLGRKKFIGFFLTRFFECGFLLKIKNLDLSLNSKILDVGSGNGYRLIGLSKHGFTDITGIDPFIKEDIYYENGIKIYKKNLEDIQEQYDFVMLNHSFEHMPNPRPVMQNLYRVLYSNRYVLIRIPVANSYSWKKYGVNWVALDAPRHLFLYTTKSIKLLAEEAGFELKRVIYDSSEYQFWGSEQYLNGIPMRDQRSYYENPDKSLFSKKKIKEFKKQARKLNDRQEGDAACFYLYKT